MTLRIIIPTDWRRPQHQQAYHLYWSDVSQYGLLHPRPTPSQIADFYQIGDYYTRSEAAQHISQTPDRVDLLTRLRIRFSWQIDKGIYIDRHWFASHHHNDHCRVLDIGCGSGHILAEIQTAGHEVIGVEPDTVARQIALDKGLQVLKGTAEALPSEINGQLFDAILMTHVLEHTLDPLLSVQNAASLLRKKGLLTLETPNNASLGMQQMGSAWRWLDVPRHLNFFTPHSLCLICEKVGLKPKAVEYRGYTRQFLPDWIQDEQEIWDIFKTATSPWDPPPRNSVWRTWQLLFKTLLAYPEKKYDSVRVIAEKV